MRGTSLVAQWLRLCLPKQEVQVPSLVGELRSHMPYGLPPKKSNHKQRKQYCNKFNIKMVHIKKKQLKK